jgi:STIM1 Orai1-activating region
VRHALYEAERQLEERLHTPFANLQQWLQLTYEVETKYFEDKRLAAEKQLQAAKEMVRNWLLTYAALALV